jgi:hypothetical protein
VLRTVLGRFALAPAGASPETTRRRGITFSPRGGASVVLAQRTRAPTPAPDLPVPVPG